MFNKDLYYKKYLKYKNKYIDLKSQLGGEGDDVLPLIPRRFDSEFDRSGNRVPSTVPIELRSKPGSATPGSAPSANAVPVSTPASTP